MEQALALHEQTLADALRVLGPNHPFVVTVRENLAGATKAMKAATDST
ncbi:hypothetical protein [Candidatus Protofrankia californiensis]